MPGTLLATLLARGDVVAVDRGRLTIAPASGRAVPPEWLAQHRDELVAAAARMTGVTAMEYLGHKVGNYGPRHAGGVTLQFRCVDSGKALYAIFNVSTRRTRTTKHGTPNSPLPKGQFRAGKRSAFVAFWTTTGIPLPRRLSAFHDCMGKLGGLIYTATRTLGDRLDAKSLRPLHVPHNALTQPDNIRTTSRQAPDNVPTRLADKELPQRQQRQGLQPDQSTGHGNDGKTVIRKSGDTGSVIPPELQSNEEWLADYNMAGDARFRWPSLRSTGR